VTVLTSTHSRSRSGFALGDLELQKRADGGVLLMSRVTRDTVFVRNFRLNDV